MTDYEDLGRRRFYFTFKEIDAISEIRLDASKHTFYVLFNSDVDTTFATKVALILGRAVADYPEVTVTYIPMNHKEKYLTNSQPILWR